ncbi:MAG: pilus assembly protein CpaE [Pseudonocardiales bacterium]|nr:pilus assembly protein CpaE [Pseudonocardiales bacterium]
MTIICEPDSRAARVLAASIRGDVQVVSTLGRAAVLLVTVTRRCPVVIGATVGFDEALRFTAQVTVEHPAAAVILVREQPSDAEVARAKKAGVHAIFSTGEHNKIAHACSAVTRQSADGQVFSVFAAKGGCGKTTIATNLAVSLRRMGGGRVCLLDLDLDFGDVASALNLDTDRTLALLIGPRDVADLVDTGDLITSCPHTGVDCILAPVAPGDAERIRPAKIGRLLRVLASRYDAIVVDLPARFSATTMAALDHAHHHIVVSTPERPALKNLRLTLDILDLLGYSRAARSVLFNRSDSGAAITAAEVAAVVRGPIAAHLPSSRDVPASINQGVPLLATQPGHPISVAIERFADRYATSSAGVA